MDGWRNDYVETNYYLVAIWVVVMIVVLIAVYKAAKGNSN